MIVQIASRSDSVTDDERRYAWRLSERFGRYFAAIGEVKWTLSAERQLRTASCNLYGKSGFYHAEAGRRTFRESINLVFRKIVEQRKRRKSIARQRAVKAGRAE